MVDLGHAVGTPSFACEQIPKYSTSLSHGLATKHLSNPSMGKTESSFCGFDIHVKKESEGWSA
jgi:hypothetical protein